LRFMALTLENQLMMKLKLDKVKSKTICWKKNWRFRKTNSKT
jgi:hypothetical protein